jgi:hypothetical protein
MKFIKIYTALVLFFIQGVVVLQTKAQSDMRNIATGSLIPDESYSDQPYVVKTNDGAWLCVMTTGAGHEGATGQHIITWRSLDQGKTWIDKQDVEPSDGPEASYAVLLKAPSGRVFVFYDHNTDNLRFIKGDSPPYKDGQVKRVDSQGYFVFKYSDDHGKTWSAGRYTIPVREFEIDRNNVYQGKIRFFWNVGKAFSYKDAAYVPLHKVGGFGEGFFTSSEGALLRSNDLFTVKDPGKATWATLPDGDKGLRTPPGGGPVAEEQSFTVLSDGSFYCVYRTIDGYPVYTYSRDGGHTWDTPQYLRYANGRLVKHPRAANFVWRCENGKYLYWFHNHGGRFIAEHPQRRTMAYNDRNPVWVLGGIEKDSDKGKIIQWTQPEILLYDDDPMIRMSYPDLVEDKGNYYITETQKDLAKVHQIDKQFLDILWGQLGNKKLTEDGQVLVWSDKTGKFPQKVAAPVLADFSVRDTKIGDYRSKNMEKGFTIDLEVSLRDLAAGQILVDARHVSEKGWYLRTTDKKTIEIVLNDGRTQSVWSCDEGMLKEGKAHRVSVIIDGGPRVITFVVDGILNDGGDTRQFGWGRFNPYHQTVSGAKEIQIGSAIHGAVKTMRIYNRALKTSEVIGNQNSGK